MAIKVSSLVICLKNHSSAEQAVNQSLSLESKTILNLLFKVNSLKKRKMG